MAFINTIHQPHLSSLIVNILSRKTANSLIASCDSNCPYDLGGQNPVICLKPECGAGSYATSPNCVRNNI